MAEVSSGSSGLITGFVDAVAEIGWDLVRVAHDPFPERGEPDQIWFVVLSSEALGFLDEFGVNGQELFERLDLFVRRGTQSL